MPGSMSDIYEKRVLNLIFNNANASGTTPLGLHASYVWVGLGTAGADGTFTELPTTGAYQRVQTARTNTTWWNAAAGETPASTTNAQAITFPTATGDWGTVTHVGIFDAATGGNVVYWASLTLQKTIGAGDTASFAGGSVAITQD